MMEQDTEGTRKVFSAHASLESVRPVQYNVAPPIKVTAACICIATQMDSARAKEIAFVSAR